MTGKDYILHVPRDFRSLFRMRRLICALSKAVSPTSSLKFGLGGGLELLLSCDRVTMRCWIARNYPVHDRQ